MRNLFTLLLSSAMRQNRQPLLPARDVVSTAPAWLHCSRGGLLGLLQLNFTFPCNGFIPLKSPDISTSGAPFAYRASIPVTLIITVDAGAFPWALGTLTVKLPRF